VPGDLAFFAPLLTVILLTLLCWAIFRRAVTAGRIEWAAAAFWSALLLLSVTIGVLLLDVRLAWLTYQHFPAFFEPAWDIKLTYVLSLGALASIFLAALCILTLAWLFRRHERR
jgi:hypothetical protein